MTIDEKSLREIINRLENEVAGDRKDIATRLQLALSYMQLGDIENAKEHLLKVIGNR